ncbi:conserved secreted protein [Mycobacteroides abscessus subsp. massiliense]|nr:conserved secreted protein [Mycobacteroides abscessus subsp. massiliense]
MRISKLFAGRVARGVAGTVVATAMAGTALVGAPLAGASAQSFCGELGGNFDGLYCHTVITSPRKADRDIKVAIPGDLVDNGTTGPTIRDYLRNLYNNWKAKGADMIQDSYGEENFQVFHHGNAMSVVFHEDYHANGPQTNNAYRTFTWDMSTGKRLQLVDILKPGLGLDAITPLAEPYLLEGFDRAAGRTARAPTHSSPNAGPPTRCTPAGTRHGPSPRMSSSFTCRITLWRMTIRSTTPPARRCGRWTAAPSRPTSRSVP